MYTIKLQKRGLPHVHILLFLHHKDKCPTPTHIDSKIKAEIPNSCTDPVAYEAMKLYMMRGPHRLANMTSPCMINARCSKHFPKSFYVETTINDDGFSNYRRRNDGQTIEKKMEYFWITRMLLLTK